MTTSGPSRQPRPNRVPTASRTRLASLLPTASPASPPYGDADAVGGRLPPGLGRTASASPGRTPRWLAEKIKDAQRLARPEPCPRCRADTLAGLDGDLCAVPARVDPTPLSGLEQAVTYLSHGGVYALIPARGGREIHRLDDFHLPEKRYDAVTDHQCRDLPPEQETLI